MKHTIFFLSVLALFTVSCKNGSNPALGSVSEQSNGSYETVSPDKFKELISSGVGIILDVRTPEEIAGGQIGDATAIDFYDEEFGKKIQLMAKDNPVYVYCHGGGRSAQAADMLVKSGFSKVYNLDGGINAWKNRGFEVTNAQPMKDDKITEMNPSDFSKLLGGSAVVLADFHTPWCSPCRKMAPIVDEIGESYKGKASVIRVNADKSKELAASYKIQAVPVFIIFKSGKEVWRKNGLLSKTELTSALDAQLK